MDNAPVIVEVVLSRKDMRKIFRTIVLGNIVAHVAVSYVKSKLKDISKKLEESDILED